MQRQYNNFQKYAGVKTTPAQKSQKGIVIMIMQGKTFAQIKRKFKWLNTLQLATVYGHLKKTRAAKGLETPDPFKVK